MFGSRLASAVGTLALLSTQVSAASSSDPCRYLVKQQAQNAQDITIVFDSDWSFVPLDAETAYECVTSVALDKDDALTMVEYAKQYSSFQTTLAYLKNPTDAYQQPAVDVIGRLDEAMARVKAGEYNNQYEFDIDMHSIVHDTHEGHFDFSWRSSMYIFFWYLPDDLVSVSSDGQELPQIYAASDILDSVEGASPIVELGGLNVFKYLQSFINSTAGPGGLIDPHADWNQVMYNPPTSFGTLAGLPQAGRPSYGAFRQTAIYQGASLKGRFANGTELLWQYVAGASQLDSKFSTDTIANIWINPSASVALPTTSAAAFTTAFLNTQPTPTNYIYQPNYQPGPGYYDKAKRQDDGSNGEPSTSAVPTETAVPYSNYPADPIVIQKGFGMDGGGVVSGYIVEDGDTKIGVLSLPSCSAGWLDNSLNNFVKAIDDFVVKAKKAGAAKLVLDVQGNGGGIVVLGYWTFRRLFPKTEPSTLFRTRATTDAHDIGLILMALWDDQEGYLTSNQLQDLHSQYGGSSYINSNTSTDADGNYWKDFDAFFGPRTVHGDKFSNNARLDLSDPNNPLSSSSGIQFPGYNGDTTEQPWAAEDIIFLTDAYCASTCTILGELLKTDAGVRSVVVGGLPEYGPMQAIAGTRGSNDRKWSEVSSFLWNIVSLVAQYGDHAVAFFSAQGANLKDIYKLPNVLEQAPWIMNDGGTFNAQDEIRRSSLDVPLSFTYQAADCRLFWTGDMVRDMTAVWKKAAKFLDGDKTVCVKGSTDGPGAARNVTLTGDVGLSHDKVWAMVNSTEVPKVKTSSKDSGDDSGAGMLAASFGSVVAAVTAVCVLVF